VLRGHRNYLWPRFAVRSTLRLILGISPCILILRLVV
jgi:hypothetical protein